MTSSLITTYQEVAKTRAPLYSQRGQVLASMSHLFPSSMTTVDVYGNGLLWEYQLTIALPTGPSTSPIHPDDLPLFAHLTT